MISARMRGPVSYAAGTEHARVLAVRQTGPPGPLKPRLLERVRETVRARHYSRRTEKAYVP